MKLALREKQAPVMDNTNSEIERVYSRRIQLSGLSLDTIRLTSSFKKLIDEKHIAILYTRVTLGFSQRSNPLCTSQGDFIKNIMSGL